jgi:hypothetical protein
VPPQHDVTSFKAWLEEQSITDDAAGDFIITPMADWQLPDAIESWEPHELKGLVPFRS